MISDDMRINVLQTCITALMNKYSNESALFRNYSIPDVRNLQSEMIRLNNGRCKDNIDPHVIAGVFMQTCKEMNQSVMYDVYNDILTTDITDDIRQSKSHIKRWIIKLKPANFQLAKTLFALLKRLSSLNSESSHQFSHIISPYICHLPTGAFMSIRHQEDLRRMKPVISFLIDSCNDIFRDLVPSHAPASRAVGNAPTTATINSNTTDTSASKISSSSGSGSRRVSNSSDKNSSRLSSDSIVSSNKMIVSIPSVNITSYTNSISSSGSSNIDYSNSNSTNDSNNSNSRMNVHSIFSMQQQQQPQQFSKLQSLEPSPSSNSSSINSLQLENPSHSTITGGCAINMHGWEWTVLESLVFSSVDSFMKGKLTNDTSYEDDSDYNNGSIRHRARIMSNSSSSTTTTTNWPSSLSSDSNSHGSVATMKNANDDKMSLSSSWDGVTMTSSIDKGKSISGSSSSGGRVRDRKVLIADFKNIKSQISNFENEWKKAHNNSMPKSSDRGHMQVLYKTYRDLKRSIRDSGATDIQRIIRGFIVRRKLVSMSRKIQLSNSNTTTNTNKVNSNSILSTSIKQAALLQPSSTERQQQQQQQPMSSDNSSSKNSTIPTHYYAKYRELLSAKHAVKRTLKKFDIDFHAQHGRDPKKVDKEVMRPTYEKYHELKKQLDDFRVTIEQYCAGPLPDEFNEDHPYMRSNISAGTTATTATTTDSENEGDNILIDSTSYNSSNSNVSIPSPLSVAVTAMDVQALAEEKINLHTYLKAYEKEFMKKKGRPVEKQDDIQPVINEYQRYKDVKALLAAHSHHAS